MSLFFLSQILAGLALGIDILSFQMKKLHHILICFILSCLLLSIHFICLNHWTAASLAFFSCICFTVGSFFRKKRYAALCLAAVIALTAYTWEGPLSLLAGAGAIIDVIAAFSENDKQLRQLMFLCTSLWIIHNILAHSPGAVAVECVFLSSNIIGYFRYYIRPRRQFLKKQRIL